MAGPTIRDVAKQAGVSTATVSRVVNGKYYVSPEVEKKVREAIAELGYFPNTVARSLRNDNTYTIGILVSDISNSYFTSLAKAVEETVKGQDYSIIVCSTEESREQELNYLRMLVGKKIDGLILNTTGRNDDFISALSADIPVVLINRRVADLGFIGDFIDSSNVEGAYELTSHLLDMGHRKIGVINGDLMVSTGRERYEGFVSAMKKAGVGVDESYRYRYDGLFSIESGFQGTSRLMALQDPPTGIIVMNNAMAIGALKYLKTNNLRVPEEVSVASYGNIDNIEVMFVQPSIVTLNPAAVGTKAGNMILERMKDHKLRNREVIFSPQLIKGNGVKKL